MVTASQQLQPLTERDDRNAVLCLVTELQAWTPQQELHLLCCSRDNCWQEMPANPVAPSAPSHQQ